MKRNKSSDKTELIIKECFLKELEKKTIDKITVSSICRQANLDRTTFYIHYSDIYALKESIEKDLLNGITEINTQIEKDKIPENEVIGLYLEYIKGNKGILKILLKSNIDTNLWKSANDTLQSFATKVILENYCVPKDITPKDFAFYINFISNGYYSVYRDWILTDCAEPSDEIIKRTTVLVNGFLSSVLIKKVL